MADLTVIILTKNEEKNIRKCLSSVKKVAQRIVVVDSFSTDNTKKICMENSVEFYENHFVDYATQFNWAIDNTNINTTWIMRLDADEEITNKLELEIINNLDKKNNSLVNGIEINMRVYFMGKWLKKGGLYPFKLLRIFRNGYGHVEKKKMDEHIVINEGEIISFNGDFIHKDFKNLDNWIIKHNWYANREVMEFHNIDKYRQNQNVIKENLNGPQSSRKRWIKNNIYYKLPLFYRSILYFIYRYVLKLGFLDGKEGLIYHFLQAFWYRFLVDAKIYECEKTGVVYGEQGDLKL
ncbi:glycosyltransferase family 2 protein [Fictibacillus sp. 5RED26]|uniref:glycosyltransferase family 2 protein n=1 Tax=Fictibacillus sp. 5RED26 TaxID=2745876 RepID=UPI0018CD9BA5|nr:glycosyltransferase family 2 protein [Fictibacillus sp. 5RED26]MBH0156613.1 glycosyltransferase family 2 protein [Fictibacillus sp. 5RED26]